MSYVKIVMQKTLWFCLLSLFFWNCDKESVGSSESEYQIDSFGISIPFEENTLFSNNFYFSQHQNIDGIDYLIGYNFRLHQLHWFDLSSLKAVRIQKLVIEGPDGVPDIHSFYVHNLDSIFLLSMRSIKLIDKDGNSKMSVPINFSVVREQGDIDFEKYFIYHPPNSTAPIYFSSKRRKLFMSVKPNVPRDSREKFDHSLCVSYDLDNDLFEFIPVKVPEEYHGQFFPLDKPFINFSDDQIIYNFSFSSKIYTYDLDSKSTSIFEGKSQLIPNSVPAMPVEELIDPDKALFHAVTNSRFQNVYYSDKFNRYYRLAFAPVIESEARRQKGKSGRILMSVFDSNFNLMDEILMKGKYSIRGQTFIKSSGVVLYPFTQYASEETLKATVFY